MTEIFLALVQGAPLTILLWAASQILSAAFAIPVAAARMHKSAWLRVPAIFWIELFRGIPTLVWMFIVFFGLVAAGINLKSVAASIAAMSLIGSAYLAETYRAGFDAVPKQQREAALALSLPLRARMSFVLLPQALPVILEGAASYSIHLLKETSVASLIGVVDIMAIANYQVGRSGDGIPIFLVAGVMYLAGCLVLAWLAHLLSRNRLAPGRTMRAA